MKTILSIDGGGMKGYIPASVLVALEGKAGKPCSEIFDLVAGTSIGGILACLIASGQEAHDALKFFTIDGPQIFGKQQFLAWNGILRPRYAAQTLEECLKARLGNCRLYDLKKALLVPAFDLASYSPYFFKNPGTGKNYALWEICRATSAAQTYFPAFKLGAMTLWDGGNVVNNPAMCVVAEALKLWPGEPLRVLSLGCGPVRSKLSPPMLINAGIVRVGAETMGLLFDANDELADYVLSQFMPQGYFRVSPDYPQSLSIDGCSLMALSGLYDAAHKVVGEAMKTLDDFISFAVSTSAPASPSSPAYARTRPKCNGDTCQKWYDSTVESSRACGPH